MKILFAIFALICAIFVQKSSAVPVESKVGNPRLFGIIPNMNCFIQCVQPVGAESADVDDADQVRGLLANYANAWDCVKKCS
ncbi:unnamed protein product [Adineta ricciae]|uniref:Uncharacterized protein n=1 Tax=Adineta ricciae TaxID=249248 RepID=A0A815A5X0_ADIRI|nr:unnamed protein product [Adineta ricciae]